MEAGRDVHDARNQFKSCQEVLVAIGAPARSRKLSAINLLGLRNGDVGPCDAGSTRPLPPQPRQQQPQQQPSCSGLAATPGVADKSSCGMPPGACALSTTFPGFCGDDADNYDHDACHDVLLRRATRSPIRGSRHQQCGGLSAAADEDVPASATMTAAPAAGGLPQQPMVMPARPPAAPQLPQQGVAVAPAAAAETPPPIAVSAVAMTAAASFRRDGGGGSSGDSGSGSDHMQAGTRARQQPWHLHHALLTSYDTGGGAAAAGGGAAAAAAAAAGRGAGPDDAGPTVQQPHTATASIATAAAAAACAAACSYSRRTCQSGYSAEISGPCDGGGPYGGPSGGGGAVSSMALSSAASAAHPLKMWADVWGLAISKQGGDGGGGGSRVAAPGFGLDLGFGLGSGDAPGHVGANEDAGTKLAGAPDEGAAGSGGGAAAAARASAANPRTFQADAYDRMDLGGFDPAIGGSVDPMDPMYDTLWCGRTNQQASSGDIAHGIGGDTTRTAGPSRTLEFQAHQQYNQPPSREMHPPPAGGPRRRGQQDHVATGGDDDIDDECLLAASSRRRDAAATSVAAHSLRSAAGGHAGSGAAAAAGAGSSCGMPTAATAAAAATNAAASAATASCSRVAVGGSPVCIGASTRPSLETDPCSKGVAVLDRGRRPAAAAAAAAAAAHGRLTHQLLIAAFAPAVAGATANSAAGNGSSGGGVEGSGFPHVPPPAAPRVITSSRAQHQQLLGAAADARGAAGRNRKARSDVVAYGGRCTGYLELPIPQHCQPPSESAAAVAQTAAAAYFAAWPAASSDGGSAAGNNRRGPLPCVSAHRSCGPASSPAAGLLTVKQALQAFDTMSAAGTRAAAAEESDAESSEDSVMARYARPSKLAAAAEATATATVTAGGTAPVAADDLLLIPVGGCGSAGNMPTTLLLPLSDRVPGRPAAAVAVTAGQLAALSVPAARSLPHAGGPDAAAAGGAAAAARHERQQQAQGPLRSRQAHAWMAGREAAIACVAAASKTGTVPDPYADTDSNPELASACEEATDTAGGTSSPAAASQQRRRSAGYILGSIFTCLGR